MTTLAELAAKSNGTPAHTATSGSAVISALSLDLTVPTNDGPVHALKDVSLDIQKREFVSSVWKSTKLIRYLTVALLLPTLAIAQVYGDAPGCAWLAGDPVQTDGLYLYDGEIVQRAESICRVLDTQQVGSGAILLSVICNGEGESWEDAYMLMTTADPDSYLIRPGDLDDTFNTEITLCVPPQD